MQRHLLLALFFSALVFQTTSAIGFTGVVEIIAGITDGIIQKDNLDEFQKCITGAETLEDNIDRAVEDFKEGGLAGYAEGLMEIQQLIQKLPQSVSTCTSIADDLTKLGQWAEIFIEPTVFIKTVSYNLVFHYSQIHADIDEAIADYDK